MASQIPRKRSPGSSAPARRAKPKGSATSKPLLEADGIHVPDSEIDFSDIPELTDAQLKSARRAGRPTHGAAPKQLIAIRLDRDLISALRKRATAKHIGYQMLIEEILTKAVRK